MSIRGNSRCSRDLAILGKYVHRLKRSVIEDVLRGWGTPHGREDLLLSEAKYKQKRPFVDMVLAVKFPQGLTYDQVAEFDLKHMQSATSSKKWTAYQLTTGSKPGTSNQGARTAPEVQTKLVKELNKYYKQHSIARAQGDAIWIRFSVWDGVDSPELPPSNAIVYIVWYPQSHYLLATAIRKEHRSILMESISRAIECDKIVECDMSGRRLDALTELLLHSKSQGAVKSLRLQKVDANPLSRRRVQPRAPSEDGDDGVLTALDHERVAKRQREAGLAFGSEKNAALESVDYRLEAAYQGTKRVKLGRRGGDLNVKVKLTGDNVIEGLKQLVNAGLAEEKLPEYLGELHSLAANSFVVRGRGNYAVASATNA